jgi:AhpD family alkylhydroperoxidase
MPIRLRYTELAPEGYTALTAFGHYVNTGTSLTPELIGLVYLRASLLNRCGFCIKLHSAELRKLNESDSRINAVGNWQNSEAFTPRERAALRWTDVMTELSTGSHASDEDYAAVTEFFKDKDIADLTFAIACINAWNRMGIAFRPEWNPKKHAEKLSEENQSVVDDDGGKVSEEE